MALPGETLRLGADPVCDRCHMHAVVDVYRSGAGWFVGSRCECGPYTRESAYYPTEQACREAWAAGTLIWR
jgi:hypothetical protein